MISKFHVFIGPLALLSVLIMETRKLAQTTSLRVCSQMKVVCPFETSGSNYTNNRRNNAEDLILRYETMFTTTRSCVISNGQSRNLAVTLAEYLVAIGFVSLSRLLLITRSLAVIMVGLLTFKYTLWRTFHNSFFLSHPNTHSLSPSSSSQCALPLPCSK